MPKLWLLLDVSFLCYRAFHTMGELSFKAIKTGVTYGFLREIVALKDRFGTERVVFCFDHGAPRRRELFEGYKAKRHGTKRAAMTAEETAAREEMQRQLKELRQNHLTEIGYRNVLFSRGFEADDIIASITKNLPEGDEAIIVSADKDMFQLLRSNVSLYNPNEQQITTVQSFKKKWGLHPKHWHRVQAMSGCKSDEVPSIEGIGEKSAIAYLLGTLNPKHKKFASIVSADGQKTIARNSALVRLPLDGTPLFELKDDQLSKEGWLSVCDKLGLRSLRDKNYLSARAGRRPSNFGFL